MTSRSWGPGKAPGDGQESARGTVGTDAAAAPNLKPPVITRWVAIAVVGLALGWTVGGRFDLVTVLGAIAGAVWIGCDRALRTVGDAS